MMCTQNPGQSHLHIDVSMPVKGGETTRMGSRNRAFFYYLIRAFLRPPLRFTIKVSRTMPEPRGQAWRAAGASAWLFWTSESVTKNALSPRKTAHNPYAAGKARPRVNLGKRRGPGKRPRWQCRQGGRSMLPNDTPPRGD